MKAHPQLDKWTRDNINNTEDVKAFFADICQYLGNGFNPDTRFNQYTGWDDQPLFFTYERYRLERAMNKCFKVCARGDKPVDIYELALIAMGSGIQND
jgi:hypothetical protein